MDEENKAVPAEAAEEVQAEAPAEEAVETEERAEAAPETEAEPPAPRKKTAQERIDEITRARREAEREREYWKQVALNKAQEATKPPQQPATPSPFPPRPVLDQFETTAEYEDALLTWHENRKEIAHRLETQRKAQEEAVGTFNRRADKVRAEHEDFDEIVEAPVFSPVMRTALLHSENGPEVAYYLGLPANRAEADRIRSLPPEVQPYELGKLETKLQLAKQTKKAPAAPPPLKPVGMSGSGGSDNPPKDIKEWMEWDRQRTMEKLKGRYGGTI